MGPEGRLLENTGDKKVSGLPENPGIQPPGTVERTLTMRDRNLIVGSCVTYCAKEGKRKVQEQVNLDRVKRLFNFEETVEYFAMINDAIEDAKVIWEGSRRRYRAWLGVKEGVLKISDVQKEYPTINPSSEPAKPAPVPPKVSQDELTGPTRTFYVPAKLDVWVTQALRDMEWPTEKSDMTEGAAELARKFDLAE